jgi:enoyl-[acyl-carrier protein] reductase I
MVMLRCNGDINLTCFNKFLTPPIPAAANVLIGPAGIGGVRNLLKHVKLMSPLQRNITIEDVGNTAAFLCSDLAAGITGEVIYVDGGYHNLGMTFEID